MPLSNMVTGTVDGVSAGRPRQGEGQGGGTNQGAKTERVEELESRIAELEATRNRLLAERRDVVARYEKLLEEVEQEPRRTDRPGDDGLTMRVARYLGLR